MIKSMTGFGLSEKYAGSAQVHSEIKSVNHRYFECTFNAPKPLLYLEDQVRKIIRFYVHRGSLSLFLSVAGSSAIASRVETNWDVVDQYIRAAKKIEKRSGLSISDANAFLQLPGVFSLREADNQSAKVIEPFILEAVHESCERLIRMREKEGAAMRLDLLQRVQTIHHAVDALEAFVPQIHAQYEQRLRSSVAAFLEKNQAIDEDRLMNEMALFINKTAINEETTRLKSHLQQCSDLLSEDEQEPVGRRIDFLIQEMNREVNTIGSKGNHAEVTRFVVTIKNEIERLREQVQNIE
ncbi:YicC/YloC family endoribonuclease [Sporolactobacillus terrae]|nr:YicC/YloC family endoribonuclease [Sporolactobacillus terrae]BBN98610.1 UPF0701 protein YloC [Sporolactobacillus terrae]